MVILYCASALWVRCITLVEWNADVRSQLRNLLGADRGMSLELRRFTQTYRDRTDYCELSGSPFTISIGPPNLSCTILGANSSDSDSDHL
jgi:hypothetical protein